MTAAAAEPGAPLVVLRSPPARPEVFRRLARALAPRKALSVSQWADLHRRVSPKQSPEPGQWVTARNPLLREPMDALSARSGVHDVVCMFPIQIGKTEIALNWLGYVMHHAPSPVMVCLPGEVSLNKWVAQKLQPMVDETPPVRASLSSLASREAANTRTFKDFAGGQLYVEHAGSPSRLKSTSTPRLIVDELDEFASNFAGGDDPVEMLNGRTSAFPGVYQRLYISTPQLRSTSRIWYLWERSDQRRYHVPCPHCGERQPLEWAGLKWGTVTHSASPRRAWYVCRECGGEIAEGHKPDMLAAGLWVPGQPDQRTRGYTANCLYYPLGLGPRWADLAELWLAAQGDPARLKTFVNDRLAEPWEDAGTRNVTHNVVQERAEPYPLRTAPAGVLAVTAGVDTQDDRLAVQIIGWGAGLRSAWVIDYVELPGDPAQDHVWTALTDLLNRPIPHAGGTLLQAEAVGVDMGGHRTEAVKAWVRSRRARRPMAVFGAVPNTAPILAKGRLADVNWRGQYDKRGVHIYQVGTVAAKHVLYARLAADHDARERWLALPETEDKPAAPEIGQHFSAELGDDYFKGLVGEVFNPSKNRFELRRGFRRVEPLDTWVYAFAATHHPELRLHRATRADWEKRALRLTPAQAPEESDLPGKSVGGPRGQTAETPAAAGSFWHSYRGTRRPRR